MRVGIKGILPPPVCLFPSPAVATRGGELRPSVPRMAASHAGCPVFAPVGFFHCVPCVLSSATRSSCGFSCCFLQLASAPDFSLRSPSPAWQIPKCCLPSGCPIRQFPTWHSVLAWGLASACCSLCHLPLPLSPQLSPCLRICNGWSCATAPAF